MRLSGRRRILAQELITTGAGASFSVRRFVTTHWRHHWHQHDELELTWIVRGHGTRQVGDSQEEFTTGDLCLLGPGLPHTWASEPRPRVTVSSLVVQFHPGFLGPRWREAIELRPLAALLDRARAGIAFSGAVAISTCGELERLFADTPGPARIGRFLAILDGLAHAGSDSRLLTSGEPAHAGTDAAWSALLARLQEHPGRAPAQAIAARQVGMSAQAFSRAFRRRLGSTYGRHVAVLRLASVCRGLAETDDGVAELALAAGFATLSAFNRRFLAVHACTPREYRRRSRS